MRCADYVCDIFVFILKLELKIEKQMIFFSINRQGGTKGNVQNNLSHFILYVVGAVFVLVYVFTVVSF